MVFCARNWLCDARALLRDKFCRAEEGSLIIFTLILFLLMAMMGGIAVDLMRYEATRVTMQQTMDRATLAAANIDQDLVAEDVVADYFAKAGLSDQLEDVNVAQSINCRQVTASAKTVSENYFMHIIGIDSIDAVGASAAEQCITNVEVVMVLDVSGSMQVNPTRITRLKSAAADFVEKVLSSDTENKISIALVPYNGQVNIGPALFAKFNVVDRQGVYQAPNSYCLDLPTSTYDSTSISRTEAFSQTPFADTYSGASNNTFPEGPAVNAAGLYVNMWCQPLAQNFVRLPNNNKDVLKAQINALVAVGATSIDLGLKWGVSLLDPSARGMLAELSSAGQIPSYFSGRPADYFDNDTMKVVILMTDGEHFKFEDFRPGYSTGLSPIWRSTGDGFLSIFHSSRPPGSQYWCPHCNGNAGQWLAAPHNSGAGAVQLDWAQVWQLARMSWVSWHLYARALGGADPNTYYTNQMNTFRAQTDTTVMNARLETLCEQSKLNGIQIYGIAFESTAQGESLISGCASTPLSNYYFDANGPQIATAFNSIASNISQLRLTQ
jgi:Flp pilus assembly protein TadG